jgi:hypothetical protein
VSLLFDLNGATLGSEAPMHEPLASFPRAWTVLALSVGLLSPPALRASEEKLSPEQKAQKARSTAPKEAFFDKTATLEGLLGRKAPGDWSSSKAATIQGTVVQIEKEEDDGDYHIILAPTGQEKDTTRWVVVEVTPAWSKKQASLSKARLEAIRGKTVRVTGWLFYEPEDPHPDPRGTRWEIHPVTDIAAVEK